jgi:hypothetical protein
MNDGINGACSTHRSGEKYVQSFAGNLKRRSLLEDLDVDDFIVPKCTSENYGRSMRK